MKTKILTGLLILLSGLAVSQEIHLLVLDSASLEPVRNAHIRFSEQNKGCITDNKGVATLKPNEAKGKIIISHINYHSKSQEILPQQLQLRILLSPRYHQLATVNIESPKPVSLTANKPWFVKDYLLLDSNILILTYVNQRFTQSRLVLLSMEGDCLSTLPLPYATGFYTDALGNHFVWNKNTVWQLHFEGNQIQLLYPCEREGFESIMSTLIDASLPNYYLRFYSYGRHCAHFWLFSETDSSRSEFHTIADGQGMNMLDDMPRMLRNASESDIRFETQIMHKPLNAPLFVNRDTIYILNTLDHTVQVFSLSGTHLYDKKQYLSTDKSWNGNLIYDRDGQKVYSVHTKNGYITLKQLRPDDFTELGSMQMPSFPYIENIKARKDKVYFLYKNFANQEYKQLYCYQP